MISPVNRASEECKNFHSEQEFPKRKMKKEQWWTSLENMMRAVMVWHTKLGFNLFHFVTFYWSTLKILTKKKLKHLKTRSFFNVYEGFAPLYCKFIPFHLCKFTSRSEASLLLLLPVHPKFSNCFLTAEHIHFSWFCYACIAFSLEYNNIPWFCCSQFT